MFKHFAQRRISPMPNLVVYNRLCGVFLVCAIATLFSQPVAAQKTTAQDVKYTGSRALYAPYWYVDNATDSYLEIKSHVQKMPITVLPTVTISDGRRVKLTSVRVLPLATVRVSIRSELMKAHVNFPAKRISKVTVWGDGSRLHSLIGAIKVDLVSPRTARGADFNGWVLVENPS